MATNLASYVSPAAWISPLAAPIGSLPLYYSLPQDSVNSRILDFVVLPILISYAYMGFLTIPILMITRSKIVWTAPFVLSLGAVLAILPIVSVFVWEGVVAMVAGNGKAYVEMIPNQPWALFWSFLASGLAVAGAFVGIQLHHRRNAI